MDIIFNSVFLKHQTGMHPENPKRLECLGNLKERAILNGEPYLKLVHTEDYIHQVRQAGETSLHLDADTATSPGSYEAAIHAVGATIMASESNDLALVRPPGHHAYPSRASGFCLFNNVAIAAQKLVDEKQRVLIFDFDGHLGDGTSEIFSNSSDVLYWSLHQFPAFPNRGCEDEIGAGDGLGYTVNVPLPPKSGDDILMHAMKTCLPVAQQFTPDVVAVSAGFDGHSSDLLLDLSLSEQGFFWIGQFLRENFQRVFATLEGGYNIATLPGCVQSFLDGINGRPTSATESLTESSMQVWSEYEFRIGGLVDQLRKYWEI